MAQPEEDIGIDVVNAPAHFFGDLYHSMLRAPWSHTLAIIAALVLGVNVIFGFVFLWTGGIANARPGSFTDAFFFSVQTVGTIGYGAMYPHTLAAHLAVTAESIVALIVAAVSTGLVFSKFSIPQARLEFARDAVVYRSDGYPIFGIRLANARGNYIVEAQVRVVCTRLEKTAEGVEFYRMYDLKLARDRSPALGRSWQVQHRIDEQSPLYGETEASLANKDVEVMVSLTGIDGTSSQTIYGRHRYVPQQIRFGHRYADMLRPKPDGRLELDYSKLHDLTKAEL